MKISGIDEDFVDIINYLDKIGYKPFSSCDGVLAHHDNPEMVDDAYISFLESPKIVELMASFLKDGRFTIRFANSTKKKPYDLYGNEIAGNTYSVDFSNQEGELTSYFKDIIMQATKENIDIDMDKDDVAKLSRLSSILEDDEKSELTYSVSLNSRMEPNRLSIGTKNGCEHKKDMYALIDILYAQFPDDEIIIDDFAKRSSEFDIIFSDEQFEQMLGVISYCKDIEHTLPILENKKILFGFEKKYDIDEEDKSTRFGIDSNGRNRTGGKPLLQQREAELSSLETEEKTISEAEALINKQKEGQDIGE